MNLVIINLIEYLCVFAHLHCFSVVLLFQYFDPVLIENHFKDLTTLVTLDGKIYKSLLYQKCNFKFSIFESLNQFSNR